MFVLPTTFLTLVFALSASARPTPRQEDPQTSLTLDPAVIAPGFANDGQDVPSAGQVASLTSTNNFINFCLTAPGVPITNGEQIRTGSCNPAPMGLIPATSAMPSSKFVFPKNGEVIEPDTPFTIEMAIRNLETGNFVNAQKNYFSAPQQLNGQGIIKGHSHVVVEEIASLDATEPLDPNVFAFFKGLNGAAQNGILTASVDKGLPAGIYRLSSINTASNHQPCLVPVAQHGSLDDAIYFTVQAGGGNNGADNANENGADNAGAGGDNGADNANDNGADNAGAGADNGADNAGAGADNGADNAGADANNGADNAGAGADNGADNAGADANNGADNAGAGADNGADNAGAGANNGADNAGAGADNGADNAGAGANNGADNAGAGADNGTDNAGAGADNGADNAEGGADAGAAAGNGVGAGAATGAGNNGNGGRGGGRGRGRGRQGGRGRGRRALL